MSIVFLLYLTSITKHRTIDNPREGISTLRLEFELEDDHYVAVDSQTVNI